MGVITFDTLSERELAEIAGAFDWRQFRRAVAIGAGVEGTLGAATGAFLGGPPGAAIGALGGAIGGAIEYASFNAGRQFGWW
jgi:hypothetical protein